MNKASDMQSGLVIRFATPADSAMILQFIRDLARYEKLEHEVSADTALLTRTIFGPRQIAEVIFAEMDEQAVGFALFFHNFSTFLGKPGLYVEDIFVRPDFRGRGIGTALFAFLADLAVRRDCGRLEWWVLDWNKSAISFYKKIGAQTMSEWTVYRLTGSHLKNLAQKNKTSHPDMVIRAVNQTDLDWVRSFIDQRWGAETVVSRGRISTPHSLPGFIALNRGQRWGLVTYQIRDQQMEIVTIDSAMPGIGCGTLLLNRVFEEARHAGCQRVWLVTTNDNINALAFYQKRGMQISAIHRHALRESRRIKPAIPLIADNGIPINDEIELEYLLTGSS